MRIPPKKPHFFQPILRSPTHGIMIPEAFLKYLKEEKKQTNAVLRIGSQKWQVEIKGRKIEEEGWRRFAQEIDLHVGDFVMFRHEGDMVFKVMVFDPIGNAREFSAFIKTPLSGKLKPNGSGEVLKGKKSMRLSGETSSGDGFPRCVISLRPCNIQACRITIPLIFAKANGLCRRRCSIIFKDQEGRAWPARLHYSCHQVYVGGLQDFHAANGLKAGEAMSIELIDNGETPVMRFQDLEKLKSCSTLDDKPSGDNVDEKITDSAQPDEADAPQRPSSTLDDKSLEDDVLEGKITDSAQVSEADAPRSPCSTLDDNLPGDNAKGKTSNITQVYREDSAPLSCLTPDDRSSGNNVEGETTDSTQVNGDDHPYYVTTVKPSKWPYLSIPPEFARSNGLNVKRCCEVILMDSRGGSSSWTFELDSRSTDQVIIRRGWANFLKENGFKEGDTLKLELINRGDDEPNMRFCCSNTRSNSYV